MPSATATDGRVISAQEAGRDASSFQRRMNNSRYMPPLPRRMLEQKEERVHVFSVSPWAHHVTMGEWGAFTIPACKDGAEYVEFFMPDSNAIPGVMTYYHPQDEHKMGLHEEDGREWAEKLLNNDIGVPKSFSLNRFGVKVCKGDKPSKRELREMTDELDTKCLELVNQAREWEGDPEKKKGIKPEVHFVAARRMNLSDESWMVASNPQGRQKCPLCGTYSDPGIIKCGGCKEYVFDHVAYAQMMAQQNAALAAARV